MLVNSETLRTLCMRLLAVGWLVLVFSCSDKEDPAPPAAEDVLVEANITGGRTAEELKFLVQLSGRDLDPDLITFDVDVYDVVYMTTYKGTQIKASGLVLLPKTTAPTPMISFQHGTIVRQADAPSQQSNTSLEVISYAALASTGLITAVPDYIGFGESSAIFHPYYIEEPTTTAVIDLLRAATALARQKDIAFDGRLFLAGYSQGGYATLATHKALETEPIEPFNLVASFSGAGGYDVTALQEHFFALETYNDPHYLAYVGLSYQSHYDKPDLLIHLFNEPYASRIPTLFDGVNGASDIKSELTNDISALIAPEVLTNSDDETNLFLREKFEENSLTDWVPSRPVFLYHGDADTTVPIANTELTYNTLLANGASAETVQLIVLPGKDHSSGIEPFIEDVVKRLDALR